MERSTRLKCYFAHSWRSKDDPRKREIVEILTERRVDVIDPFVGEEELCGEYGEKGYFPNCNYKLGRAIWVKDLGQIAKCDMFLVWIPDNLGGRFIGSSYELCYAFTNHKFIQIISALKHPCMAYVISGGNQHFESIKDFKNLRVTRWS